jgi:hypothetical protein
MEQVSERAFEAIFRLGRFLAVVTFLAVGISIVPTKVSSQTISCKELVAELAAQQKLIGIFRTIDFNIRQHFVLEADAFLSTYGGWNTLENWGSNAGKFRASKPDFDQQVFVLKRDISRSKAIGEEESKRFNSALDTFVGLIETGDRISSEIDAGRLDEANQIYFETARPNYIQVYGELYTLITNAERRVAVMARTQCD